MFNPSLIRTGETSIVMYTISGNRQGVLTNRAKTPPARHKQNRPARFAFLAPIAKNTREISRKGGLPLGAGQNHSPLLMRWTRIYWFYGCYVGDPRSCRVKKFRPCRFPEPLTPSFQRNDLFGIVISLRQGQLRGFASKNASDILYGLIGPPLGASNGWHSLYSYQIYRAVSRR